jgi:alpha-1,3/alpha-1,6-mannosyltransferase
LARKEHKIVFFHTGIGIVAAERLVLDAAYGLHTRGFKLIIFTRPRSAMRVPEVSDVTSIS